MNPHVISELLQIWPRGGARTAAEFDRLFRAGRALGISVDPCVPRGQLRRAAANLAHHTAVRTAARAASRSAAVPWKYQRYLKPYQNMRQQALKIQPGATLPVALNGLETTMYVDTARRLNFRGKPWFIELKVKLNTEHIPVILQNQTKCECLYCGVRPVSDEDSCRSCGAPLPDC